ncbi:MAG: 50S ribosomal protein L9 [Saprospiraceae bacterium]
MEIILLKDLEKVGYKHDVVTVKNGYGRNYLIPQGMAVIANATNKKKLEAIVEEIEAKELANLGDYKAIAEKLEGQTVKVGVKAGTSGKIFGSVTVIQITNAITEQYSTEIERKKISISNNIKEIGTYDVTLNLHKEVVANMFVELIAE